MRSVVRIALVVALAFGAASPIAVRAEDDAAGDLAFWQSIQTSTNPAEYQAYLNAFPNGRFKALALHRLKNPPAPAPNAVVAPAPAPAPNPIIAPTPAPGPAPVAEGNGTEQPNIVGDGSNKVIVQPTTARVGQKFKVSFSNFPDPNTDVFLVVRAGTPDFNPVSPPVGVKPLDFHYIYNRENLTDQMVGPFAPGNYEARYMTKLYNNDGRYETSARTMFSVR